MFILASAGHAITGDAARLVLQLAVILIATRSLGLITERFTRLPRVLGELAAGLVIGPFALGAIPLGTFGPLFPIPEGSILPVSTELYCIGSVAVVLLLFLAGLETNLSMFIHFAAAGSVVGLFGVGVSFFVGAASAVWFGVADSIWDVEALFLGAIATATSVGITARILSERRALDTPEGVTIMASAVLDDVLGIIIVAMVAGVATGPHTPEGLDWYVAGGIALKAAVFFVVCATLTLLTAPKISRAIKVSRDPGAMITFAFGLALLLAGITEMAGLAMIIGAYMAGLALSRTDLALYLQERLHPVSDLFVPVFFCLIGMMVNLAALEGVLVFGLAYSLLGVLSKVAGCGFAALLVKFNLRGALRIGLGMLPRGEVTLIIAGTGYASGAIPGSVFGVAVMMTILSTLIAPPLLVKSLGEKPGTKASRKTKAREPLKEIRFPLPSRDIGEFLLSRIIRALQEEEFFISRLQTGMHYYQVRKDQYVFSIQLEDATLRVSIPKGIGHIVQLILAEELLSLKDLMEASHQLDDLQEMEGRLLKDLFSDAPETTNGHEPPSLKLRRSR